MVRVKICGITNPDDAMVAVTAGADALGFVFAESPRRVAVEAVAEILKIVPPMVATMGVFANQSAEEVVRTVLDLGLNFAQIHGDLGDRAVLAKHLGCKRIIRALRVRTEEDLTNATHDCPKCGCAAFLLDAHVDGVMGGTGVACDWELASKAHSLGRPLILAGGLNPNNVAAAISVVRPYAVDVSSGVEIRPGKKDHFKIEEFIRHAKQF